MSNFDAHKLRQQIKQKFNLYDSEKQYAFDQILFILDQECESGKCDRDVARQLFQQSLTPNGKANLNQIIFRYVQNLQTSNLCLIRQQKGAKSFEQQLGNLKGSTKAYAYIKIIQITAYARHSGMPSLTYKIQPSDIPPVTVVNSINPILNHEYTLQLENNNFSILFFESGIQIAEWVWPDSSESIYEGQYYRNIMAQNISFQLKINYKPKNYHPDRKILETNLKSAKQKLVIQSQALRRLEHFQPFTGKSTHKKIDKSSRQWVFVQKLFSCLPLLRRHVRNLYYSLILLIILQCLTAISWPMQFLDITVAFGIIGTLYDQAESDLGMEMLVCVLSFAILIIKSIWGLVVIKKESLNWTVLLIICIVMKFICIFFAWIVSVCKQQVPMERQYTFYEQVDPNVGKGNKYFQLEQKYDIFQ